jgi:hypothetical protein
VRAPLLASARRSIRAKRSLGRQIRLCLFATPFAEPRGEAHLAVSGANPSQRGSLNIDLELTITRHNPLSAKSPAVVGARMNSEGTLNPQSQSSWSFKYPLCRKTRYNLIPEPFLLVERSSATPKHTLYPVSSVCCPNAWTYWVRPGIGGGKTGGGSSVKEQIGG